MTADNIRNDAVLAVLGDLPAHDVDDIRAHRIRRRCHTALAPKRRRPVTFHGFYSLPWRRVLAPAVAAMWGALYVIETLRQAVAIYRF